MARDNNLCIYVISDSTGRTAELVMKAVLVQFPAIIPTIKKFSKVQTKEEIISILNKALHDHGIVIYSLVSKKLRNVVQREGKKRNLFLFDLLGPLMRKLHSVFNLIPLLEPGLLKHSPHDEDLRLVEAIHYTLKHDDGLGLETVHAADIVILGVSRTLKTPSSIYVACTHSLKVANIPIILETDVPREVFRGEGRKIGFTIDPERLLLLRKERVKSMPDYTNIKGIYKELEYSREVFRRFQGVHVIDVTNQSIEEIAARIVN